MQIRVSLRNGIIAWSCDGESVNLPRFLTLREIAQEAGLRVTFRGSHLVVQNLTTANFASLSTQGATSVRIVSAVARLLANYVRNNISNLVVVVTASPVNSVQVEGITLDGQAKIILGNQVYDLMPSQDRDASSAVAVGLAEARSQVATYQQAYLEAMGTAQAEVERRVREIERRLQENVSIPSLSVEDILYYHLRVFATGRFLNWLLPFIYQPCYLAHQVREETLRWRLSAEHTIALRRELLLKVQTERDRFHSAELAQEVEGQLLPFEHYHSGCWGTLHPPRELSLPRDLYLLRDQMQRELEIINTSSLANQNPSGLPHSNELERDRRELLPEVPIAVGAPVGITLQEPTTMELPGPRRRRGWTT